MHEYSLASGLLDRVAVEARARGALRVTRLWVRVGDAAGVDGGLLRTAWELCREGTCCGDAGLEIAEEPVRWICGACGADVPPAGARRCPACGAPARLAGGDELILERIEMEVADV